MKRSARARYKHHTKVRRVSTSSAPSPSITMSSDMDDESDGESITYDCPIVNRFEKLVIPREIPPVKTKTSIMPPRIVVDACAKTIRQIIPAEITNFALENKTQGQTSILCNSKDQHSELLQLFKSNKLPTHTFADRDDKLNRFVLYGLNTYTKDQIINELKEYDLHPVDVKPMTVKHQRYDDHATYIVYFKRGSGININIVKQAKYLLNTKVRWEYYKFNSEGAEHLKATCRNCWSIGHAANFCHRPAICGVCAGPHTTKNCKHLIRKRTKNETSIPDKHIQCARCGEKTHTAYSSACPKLKSFLDNAAIRRATKEQRTRFINAPAPTQNHWDNTNQLLQNKTVNRQRHFPPINQNVNPSYESNTTNSSGSDTFTPKQISEIFNHIINCVANCRSKQEQLSVVVKVITEYYI